MKVKASVTIEEKSLAELDGYVGNDNNRSALVQEAIDQWLARKKRAARDARDAELFEKHHESIDRDLLETLEFSEWSK